MNSVTELNIVTLISPVLQIISAIDHVCYKNNGLCLGVGANKGRLSEWIQHYHNATFIHHISQVWLF